MNIIGIFCFYHDSAACIIRDGVIMAAAQEERFTRKKHDPRFPKKAVKYCLEEAGITSQDLDYVVFYDKPFLTFERLLMSYLTVPPKKKAFHPGLKPCPCGLGRSSISPKSYMLLVTSIEHAPIEKYRISPKNKKCLLSKSEM